MCHQIERYRVRTISNYVYYLDITYNYVHLVRADQPDVPRKGVLAVASARLESHVLLGLAGVIEPEQIGEHKLQLHREFLQRWVDDHAGRLPAEVRSLAAVWQVRERCIAALAQ